MIVPKKNQIAWLIKVNKKKVDSIGFLRSNFPNFYVIGSPTGSYCSGHGEKWRDKWVEFLEQGFLPLEIALKKNLIKSKWSVPKISREDKLIIKKLNKISVI